VRRGLEEKRSLLDRIAKELLERETIDQTAFERLVG
jgi:ATP-dependent Zn protease